MLNHPANILPCRKGQSGSALIMALLVLLVMSIVVMGMATDSDLDLKISRNLQQKNEAFNNAETGIDVAIEMLRYSIYADKDPTNLHIGDFELPSYYGSLNDDFEIKSVNPLTPSMDRFLITSKGFSDGVLPAVQIVQSQVKHLKFMPNYSPPAAALSIFNPDPIINFGGNIGILGDENVDDDYIPSLYIDDVDSDFTEDDISGQAYTLDPPFDGIKNHDKQNYVTQSNDDWIATAEFFSDLAAKTDRYFNCPDDDPQDLGSPADPKISVLDGCDKLAGGTDDGAGILVIRNGIKISGNFQFDGLVIAIIESEDDEVDLIDLAGTPEINGAFVTAGSVSEVGLHGTPDIIYDKDSLDYADTAFNRKAIIVRESWKAIR